MCKCTLCTRFEEACFVTSSLSRKPRDGIRDFFFNQESKLDTKERYWGQQFCQFGPTRPVKVDHLQSWSPIFRSDQLNIHSVSFDQWNVRNVGLTCGDGDLQRCWYKVLEVSDLSKLPGIFLLISPSENKTILARATQITIFFFSMDTFISFLSLPLSLSISPTRKFVSSFSFQSA